MGRADPRQWPRTPCTSGAKWPRICSVDMKVIHLSRGNLGLRLEMLMLTFTEAHIVALSHNVFDLTGGAKIALVALVGQRASLGRVPPPLSPISSRFYSPEALGSLLTRPASRTGEFLSTGIVPPPF